MTIRWFAGAMLLALALPLVAQDSTPPVVTPNVSGTVGQNDWFVSDVALSWTVSDPESAVISTSGCEGLVLMQDDTMRPYTCVATSAGGTTAVTYTIGRDTTPPLVQYLGVAGSFRVSWTVSFNCNVLDVTSGVASTDCTSVFGNAYDFNIGENVITSSATDNAGNTGSGSVSFTVFVDAAGMSDLVDRFVTRESFARSLKRKLLAGQVPQVIRAVERETGKSISEADAATLLRLAAYL